MDKILKKLVETFGIHEVELFTLLFSLSIQKVSNIPTVQMKRAMTLVKKFKLHLAVDRFTSSNLDNKSRCIEMVQLFISTSNNLGRVQNMLVDSGYSGEKFAAAVKQILGCSVEVVKKSDLHSFKVMPKRWIVERTFA